MLQMLAGPLVPARAGAQAAFASVLLQEVSGPGRTPGEARKREKKGEG